jgi:hypothetical protein
MIKPGPYNLEIRKGADLGPLRIIAKDGQTPPVPVDLTGWTASAHVRSIPGGVLLVDLEPAITDAVNGEITIHLSAEQTENLAAGRYGWDLMLTTATGRVIGPVLAGTCLVIKPYTEV